MIEKSSQLPRAIEMSAAELNTLLREPGCPVLAYIWAPWCPPCRLMTPAMDEVTTRTSPDIKLIKLNAVTESYALTAFNIASVPTLLLFSSDGQLVARQLGAMTAAATLEWLEQKLHASA